MSAYLRSQDIRNFDSSGLRWSFFRGSIARRHRPAEQRSAQNIWRYLSGVILESNQTALPQAKVHLKTLRFLSRVRWKVSSYCKACQFDPRTNSPIASVHWTFLARHASLLRNNARTRLSLRALDRRSPNQQMYDAQAFAAVQGILQVGKPIDYDGKRIPLG